MLDAARDDDELTFTDDGFAVAKFHVQRAFDDEEKFVFGVVMVPDKFTLQLDRFDFAVVDCANDAGVAVVGEAAELFFEIDGFHFAPELRVPARFCPQQTGRRAWFLVSKFRNRGGEDFPFRKRAPGAIRPGTCRARPSVPRGTTRRRWRRAREDRGWCRCRRFLRRQLEYFARASARRCT